MTTHLHSDTDEQRLATANSIDKEERSNHAADHLGHGIQTGGVDLGISLLNTKVAEDGRQIVRDGVGTGHLSEDVGHDCELHAAQVGPDGEGLAESGLQSSFAILSKLELDGSVDAVELGNNVVVIGGDATKPRQNSQGLLLTSLQAKPSRRLVNHERERDSEEGRDDLDEEGGLPLEILGGRDVNAAAVNNKDTNHLRPKHPDIKPERHQPTGNTRSDLNDGHRPSDSEGADASTRDQTAYIQGANVAVGEGGDESADGDDDGVDAEGPATADAVVEEEGEEGADAGCDVDEGDDVREGFVVFFGGHVEFALEALELRDGGG